MESTPWLAPQFRERAPRVDVSIEHGQRPMNEEQIEHIQAQLVHARIVGGQCTIVALLAVRQLGGDGEVRPGNVDLGNGRPYSVLVLVPLGGVDEAGNLDKRGAEVLFQVLTEREE
jgi:hypothetical protein